MSGDTWTARARTVGRVLTGIELTAACAAAVMVFVVVLYQAAQRHLPITNIVWTSELAEFGLVWMTFLAVGVLVSRDGHIALQVVDTIPNEHVVRGLHVLAMVLVALISAGFAWACWQLMFSAARLTSPALGLPMPWVYSAMFVGLVSATVRALVRAGTIARRGVAVRDGAVEIPAADEEGPR